MLRYSVFILSLGHLIQFHLRVYALTFGNKLLVVYFGALALTKFVVSLASFLPHETVVDPPPIPLEVFKMCATLTPLPFKSVPIAIGTVFGEWLHFSPAACVEF